jgi:hypothetical protein
MFVHFPEESPHELPPQRVISISLTVLDATNTELC